MKNPERAKMQIDYDENHQLKTIYYPDHQTISFYHEGNIEAYQHLQKLKNGATIWFNNKGKPIAFSYENGLNGEIEQNIVKLYHERTIYLGEFLTSLKQNPSKKELISFLNEFYQKGEQTKKVIEQEGPHTLKQELEIQKILFQLDKIEITIENIEEEIKQLQQLILGLQEETNLKREIEYLTEKLGRQKKLIDKRQTSELKEKRLLVFLLPFLHKRILKKYEQEKKELERQYQMQKQQKEMEYEPKIKQDQIQKTKWQDCLKGKKQTKRNLEHQRTQLMSKIYPEQALQDKEVRSRKVVTFKRA